ncbi:MAG TPA: hypothetical protein VGE01_06225 [Fimbriimonas sp.]
MKKLASLCLLVALLGQAAVLSGCDDEIHADPALEKAMNDQRAAQAPGQTPQPPTGDSR